MTAANFTNTASTSASLTLAIPAGVRRVTYIFDTKATSQSLSIPFATRVNGQVQPGFEDKPSRVSGKHGKIEVDVAPGAKVSLYLNSDAHPAYRQHPVYEVTAQDHHIEVKITEKKGKLATPDTPQPASSNAQIGLDKYTAPLTGDIWMKVTHRYTSSEAGHLIPANTPDAVKAAVRSIYDGLSSKKLTISVPATATTPEKKLVVTFNDSDNPKDNITAYQLLSDGLTRVHPAGYAAIFTAAVAAGVPSLLMSSAWRPCLGSIAHRAGLGVDVSQVGDVLMNRQELLSDAAVDTDNVSEEEKRLFKAFKKEEQKEKTAKADTDAKNKKFAAAKKDAHKAKSSAEKAHKAAKKYKNDPVKGPPAAAAAEEADAQCVDADAKCAAAEKAWKDAREVSNKASEARAAAEQAWCDERDKNQPQLVKAFRAALAASPAAQQLLDPWFMDVNTKDNKAATPNYQENDLETLHAHHLHLTVAEPKIL